MNAITYVTEQHAGPQPWCVLREDETYGRSGADGIRFAERAMRVRPAVDLTFDPIATDFDSQLDALSAARCRTVVYSGLPFHTNA